MTLATIIVIVLGIVVLVFLIFGFSKGWNNLWDKVTNLGGGEANLNTIKQSCDIVCGSQDTDNYCNFKRTVKFGTDVKGVTRDCTSAENPDDKRSDCFATCEVLAKSTAPEEIRKIGVSDCPPISCNKK